jgi:hypothetical protein
MRKFILGLTLASFCSPAYGFMSVMDTGDLKREGEYRILGEGQVLFDSPEGFNLNARFATGIDEESAVQFEAGVGSVDYYLGAFYKWIPIPDTIDQPAVGGRAGFVFADFNGFSTYGINVSPLISKRFETSAGDFSPYGAFQLGLLDNVNDTVFSMHAVVGLQWKPNRWDFPQLKDFQFLLEYGIEIDDAFNYLSLGASYDF